MTRQRQEGWQEPGAGCIPALEGSAALASPGLRARRGSPVCRGERPEDRMCWLPVETRSLTLDWQLQEDLAKERFKISWEKCVIYKVSYSWLFTQSIKKKLLPNPGCHRKEQPAQTTTGQYSNAKNTASISLMREELWALYWPLRANSSSFFSYTSNPLGIAKKHIPPKSGLFSIIRVSWIFLSTTVKPTRAGGVLSHPFSRNLIK